MQTCDAPIDWTLLDRQMRRLTTFVNAATKRGHVVYKDATDDYSQRVVLSRDKCLHEVVLVEFPHTHMSGKTFTLEVHPTALTAFHNYALNEVYLLPPALHGREICLQVLREFYTL